MCVCCISELSDLFPNYAWVTFILNSLSGSQLTRCVWNIGSPGGWPRPEIECEDKISSCTFIIVSSDIQLCSCMHWNVGSRRKSRARVWRNWRSALMKHLGPLKINLASVEPTLVSGNSSTHLVSMIHLLCIANRALLLDADFSDRVSQGRRTGYDIPRTEYEIVSVNLGVVSCCVCIFKSPSCWSAYAAWWRVCCKGNASTEMPASAAWDTRAKRGSPANSGLFVGATSAAFLLIRCILFSHFQLDVTSAICIENFRKSPGEMHASIHLQCM